MKTKKVHCTVVQNSGKKSWFKVVLFIRGTLPLQLNNFLVNTLSTQTRVEVTLCQTTTKGFMCVFPSPCPLAAERWTIRKHDPEPGLGKLRSKGEIIMSSIDNTRKTSCKCIICTGMKKFTHNHLSGL